MWATRNRIEQPAESPWQAVPLARWLRAAGIALAILGGVTVAEGQPASSRDTTNAREKAASAAAVRVARSRAPVLGLARCLQLAERNYPKIHEARAEVRKSQADRRRAYWTPYSQMKITGAAGLVPSLSGTNLYSEQTDVSIDSNMSLAWQTGVEWGIPLWTFGKISNVWDAADANVLVKEHQVRKARNEVLLDVRRAYYGAQLAHDALALVREAMRRIDRHLDRMARAVEEGEGDDIELLKLRMYRAELDARASEAEKQRRVALAGLRFLTGIQGQFEISSEPLHKIRHRLGPLLRYLTAARLYRPEINMARAGVRARQAQLQMERARFYPDIALGLRWKWGRAPDVVDQRNPFVSDSLNYHSYVAGLVLKWDFEPIPTAARLAAARAELEKMRATERFALGGVGVEVEEAYAEAEDATRRLDAYESAVGYAKQWLIKVQQGIDVGMMDDEEIVDPAKEYALKRFSLMTATFDYNLALARLALATGWDEVAPP